MVGCFLIDSSTPFYGGMLPERFLNASAIFLPMNSWISRERKSTSRRSKGRPAQRQSPAQLYIYIYVNNKTITGTTKRKTMGIAYCDPLDPGKRQIKRKLPRRREARKSRGILVDGIRWKASRSFSALLQTSLLLILASSPILPL